MSWFKNLLGIKPSQDEFARVAEKFLARTTTGDKQLVYDKDAFSISVKEADGAFSGVYYLGNAYAEYCAAPGLGRGKVLAAYFTNVPDMPESLDEAIANILPRVQQRSFYEELAMKAGGGHMSSGQDLDKDRFEMPYITIAEHFAEGLAYDGPKFVAQISSHKLGEWKTSLEELLPRALDNLAKLTPKPFEPLAQGIYISQCGDTHDASRMLLLDRIRECKVMGRPVVLIPNRNTLLLTGESDANGMSLILNIAEDVLKHPRPMACIPLVLSESTWYQWQVRHDHPEQKRFARLRAIAMNDIYNSHKELLDAAHEEKEVDIFVATYMAMESQETGEITSCATWSDGVHSLLPRVDKLVLIKSEGEEPKAQCTVSWEVAERIVGDLMQRVEGYPARWEVKAFPNEAQLLELKKHSDSD